VGGKAFDDIIQDKTGGHLTGAQQVVAERQDFAADVTVSRREQQRGHG